MEVCIDATPLLLRSAGVKTYFYHWLRHLWTAAQGDSSLRLHAFPRLHDFGTLDHQASHLNRFSTLWRLSLLLASNALIPVPGALQLLLPRFDVLHASNQMRKPPRRARLTATVYDMTAWIMPELHTQANVVAESNFAGKVLRRAAGLIAISENTRRDAARVLALDPERIDVIYPGVAESYFTTTRVPIPGRKPYILSLGTIEPRKNIGRLLDAYAALPSSFRDEFDLVVAGPAGWNTAQIMARLRDSGPGVRYVGYVPETELPTLVAGATVLAYPSLYEGFGLPLAQAMAAGVPAITSATSCLPEVAGDGALFVDPQSTPELTAALGRVLCSSTLQRKLSAAGSQRARQHFRWSECARRSLEFFRKAASR
jgi:alpha-1,3-rhamnosyl/mannosyltransferase